MENRLERKAIFMTEKLLTQLTTPALSQPELFRPPLAYPDIAYDKMLTHSATHWPENVAVVFRDSNITFRELEALTNQFAHALQGLGVKQGERVCLFMTNRPEFVISCYAITRIGAIFNAINPAGYNGNRRSTAFGQPSSFAGDPLQGEQRLAQVGLRFHF